MIEILYSNDEQMVKRTRDERINSLLSEPRDEFNCVVMSLEHNTTNEVIEEILTLPMFSLEKVVVIKNATMFTGSKDKQVTKEEISMWLDLLEQQVDNHVIFEVYQEKLDGRKKITKLIESSHRATAVEPPSERQFSHYITEQLAKDDYTMDQPAMKRFIERIGVNLQQADIEIEKLKTYTYDSRVITLEAINDIVPESIEEEIYILTDLIKSGKKQLAAKKISELILRKEEPIALLGLIASQYRLYYQTKLLSMKGMNKFEIGKTLGVHHFRIQLALEQCHRLELMDILAMLNICAELDFKLKDTALDKEAVMQLYVANL